MLTRRENLLIRPWQDRRYINHRNKVEHALPAIDVKPPIKRAHVTCKLKKLQKEAERCARIEQDNFTLLQHLRSIMHSSRIDNVWQEAPPNFLHRVGIYYSTNGGISECEPLEYINPPMNRKERCFGCSPHRIEKKGKIPEERVPWDPPRPRLSRRESASLVINGRNLKNEVIQSNTKVQDVQNKKNIYSCPSTGKQKHKKNRSRARSAVSTKTANKLSTDLNRKILPDIETQSIILKHGALKLSVNFPPHSKVILKEGVKEKVLQSEFCECKAIHRNTGNDDSKDSAINST